ncbi:MAG: hypothetical protein RLZZ117_535 [Cyanobacteriota bacterium]|jgi:hypothetical protein
MEKTLHQSQQKAASDVGAPTGTPSSKDPADLPNQRFELRTTKRFLQALDALAAKEGRSRADIVRRAVGVYSMGVSEKAKGNLLAFVKLQSDNSVSVEEIITL